MQVTFWIGHTPASVPPAGGLDAKHAIEGLNHKPSNNGSRRSSIQAISDFCGMEPAQIHILHNDHSELSKDTIQAKVPLLQESAENSDICSFLLQVPKQLAEEGVDGMWTVNVRFGICQQKTQLFRSYKHHVSFFTGRLAWEC